MRRSTAAALAPIMSLAALVLAAPTASTAPSRTWYSATWHSATWGRGYICVEAFTTTWAT